MFCNKCGKPLQENALFCGYCGAPAIRQYEPKPEELMPNTMPELKHNEVSVDETININEVIETLHTEEYQEIPDAPLSIQDEETISFVNQEIVELPAEPAEATIAITETNDTLSQDIDVDSTTIGDYSSEQFQPGPIQYQQPTQYQQTQYIEQNQYVGQPAYPGQPIPSTKVKSKKKGKLWLIISIVAVAVIGIAITGLVIMSSRLKSEALTYVSDNFIELANEQIQNIDMSPELKSMVQIIHITDVQLSDDKNTIEVQYSLPDFDLLRKVGEDEYYDPFATTPEEYICRFYESYSSIDQTYSSKEYVATVSVKFKLFTYETDWSNIGYGETVEKYSAEFNRILEDRISTCLLNEALSNYMFPDPDKNNGYGYSGYLNRSDEYIEFCKVAAELLASKGVKHNGEISYSVEEIEKVLSSRVHFLLYPSKVDIKVKDYGYISASAEYFDYIGLLSSIEEKQYSTYEKWFLRDPITSSELENDIAIQLASSARYLRDASDEGRKLEGEELVAPITNETYAVDLLGIVTGTKKIGDDRLDTIIHYLNAYDDEVASLKSRTDLLEIHTPVTAPENGILYGSSTGLELTIENTKGNGDYYIVFVLLPNGDINEEGTDQLGVYIHDGSKYKVRLPAGSYRIKYASGESTSWYGLEDLFGPSGYYQISTEKATLVSGSYTLTLNTSAQTGQSIGDKKVSYDDWH